MELNLVLGTTKSMITRKVFNLSRQQVVQIFNWQNWYEYLMVLLASFVELKCTVNKDYHKTSFFLIDLKPSFFDLKLKFAWLAVDCTMRFCQADSKLASKKAIASGCRVRNWSVITWRMFNFLRLPAALAAFPEACCKTDGKR